MPSIFTEPRLLYPFCDSELSLFFFSFRFGSEFLHGDEE